MTPTPTQPQTMTRCAPPPTQRQRQQGLAVLLVLTTLLLSSLLLLGAYRGAVIHTALQAHRSDLQRTLLAAEALLEDAIADIRTRPRLPAQPWFPRSNLQFDALRTLVRTHSPSSAMPCLQGICVPASAHAMDQPLPLLDGMRAQGACYGQYTLAAQPDTVAPDNPLLHARRGADNACLDARAWYWIEVFLYPEASAANGLDARLLPDPGARIVYRITALARGLRPDNQAVLRTLFIPFPAHQNP